MAFRLFLLFFTFQLTYSKPISLELTYSKKVYEIVQSNDLYSFAFNSTHSKDFHKVKLSNLVLRVIEITNKTNSFLILNISAKENRTYQNINFKSLSRPPPYLS